jgi:hypothetical protein
MVLVTFHTDLALHAFKGGVRKMKDDMVYVSREVFDHLSQLFAEQNDKELREHFEEKPKKDPYFQGFNGANNFFNRKGKRYGIR